MSNVQAGDLSDEAVHKIISGNHIYRFSVNHSDATRKIFLFLSAIPDNHDLIQRLRLQFHRYVYLITRHNFNGSVIIPQTSYEQLGISWHANLKASFLVCRREISIVSIHENDRSRNGRSGFICYSPSDQAGFLSQERKGKKVQQRQNYYNDAAPKRMIFIRHIIKNCIISLVFFPSRSLVCKYLQNTRIPLVVFIRKGFDFIQSSSY